MTPTSAGSEGGRAGQRRVSRRLQTLPESAIGEMTRVAALHGAINLAQGCPDFDPPSALIEAAEAAMEKGCNQYSITWGSEELRNAIARKAMAIDGVDVDPEENVVVTCGSTEAMMAAMLSLVDVGDEVIIFEPFYENYAPDAIMCGACPRYVPMRWPDWSIHEEQLKAAFTTRTKVLILNTPNNPTGKVFERRELELITDLCEDNNVVAVADEIYRHIVYDGLAHISLASIGDMADRTITIDGLSKTYSATGWRIGWAIAPTGIAGAMRRTHDFLTLAAPHPYQVAAAAALDLPDSYYEELIHSYQRKRDRFVRGLQSVGLDCRPPDGAYYVMADVSGFPFKDDWSFVMHLVEQFRVAVLPGSCLYSNSADGCRFVRLMFSQRDETLEDALVRLSGLRELH